MEELENKVKKIVYITIGIATFLAVLSASPYLMGYA